MVSEHSEEGNLDFVVLLGMPGGKPVGFLLSFPRSPVHPPNVTSSARSFHSH